MSLLDCTAVELAAKIKAGEVTAVEAMQAVVAQIEKSEDKLNCYVTFDKEKALQAAAKADDDIKAGKLTGPLAGVPFAIKDNMCTEGMLTTFRRQVQLLSVRLIWMSSPWAQQQKQVHSEQLRIQEIQSTFLVVHQVVQLQQLQQMNALRHLVQIQVVL